MKRYRIVSFNFDLGTHIFTDEIRDDWDDQIKETHVQAKKQAREWFESRYGAASIEEKIANYVDLGPNPISILAFHNRFFEDIRTAFIMGSYYPALTGACALGERILNHLMIKLRNDFASTLEYEAVSKDKSFSNWKLLIDTLATWSILQPAASDSFRRLARVRHKAIHFNPETDHNDRALALDALRLMTEVIERQFCCTGGLPWVKWICPGEMYVDRTTENQPFVKKIVLPNCVYVGPCHNIESIDGGRWTIRDDTSYEDREITDDEFAALRKRAIESYFAGLKSVREN